MSNGNSHRPRNWQTVPLGYVGEVIRGVTYKKDQARETPQPGYLPLLRATNIGDELSFDGLVYVPEALVSTKQRLQRDDLVIAASSGSIKVVGKAAQLRDDWEGTFGAFCAVFRPNASVDARYIAYFMQSPGYRTRVSNLAAGVNINNLRREHLLQTPVPCPPLDEQRRTVAALDQVFSGVGLGLDAFDRASRGLRTLERSLFFEAMAGRLAPRTPATESADELLGRLGVEQIPRDEVDPSWPDHWGAARLGDLASHITSGSRDWRPYYQRGTGVFLLTQNVRMRRLDLSEPFHVDPPLDDPARARSAIAKDDLLVTIVGANVGNTARVPDDLPEHYVCQSLGLVRPREPAMSRFLELFLAAPHGGQAFFETCFYGQGRPHISFADLKRMPVPVPPLAEQAAIVSKFERQTAEVHRLADVLEAAKRDGGDLLRAALHQAFSPEVSARGEGQASANKPRAVLVGS